MRHLIVGCFKFDWRKYLCYLTFFTFHYSRFDIRLLSALSNVNTKSLIYTHKRCLWISFSLFFSFSLGYDTLLPHGWCNIISCDFRSHTIIKKKHSRAFAQRKERLVKVATADDCFWYLMRSFRIENFKKIILRYYERTFWALFKT